METEIGKKGIHSWAIGQKGEDLAKRILQRMGFTIVESEGKIDEYPFIILAPRWYFNRPSFRNDKHGIAGLFAFDLYAEKGKEKWFIEVKTTEQKREHGIHLTNRQCRFGSALTTLGYNVGMLRIRLREKEGKKVIQANLHKIPSIFFRNLFSKGRTEYYPKMVI